jgi:hypothetical protein
MKHETGVAAGACRVPELGRSLRRALSRCGFVLGDEATEDRSTPDPAEAEIRNRRFWAGRAQL